MAPPINVQDWYGDRHTCQIASGALGRQACMTLHDVSPDCRHWPVPCSRLKAGWQIRSFYLLPVSFLLHIKYTLSCGAARTRRIIRRVNSYWKECNIDLRECFPSSLYAERLKRLDLWTPEERRNWCDLIIVFKLFNGYTEIYIRVLFTRDGNDKGLRGHL